MKANKLHLWCPKLMQLLQPPAHYQATLLTVLGNCDTGAIVLFCLALCKKRSMVNSWCAFQKRIFSFLLPFSFHLNIFRRFFLWNQPKNLCHCWRKSTSSILYYSSSSTGSSSLVLILLLIIFLNNAFSWGERWKDPCYYCNFPRHF